MIDLSLVPVDIMCPEFLFSCLPLYTACLMKMEEWEKALVHTAKVNIYLHSYLLPGIQALTFLLYAA